MRRHRVIRPAGHGCAHMARPNTGIAAIGSIGRWPSVVGIRGKGLSWAGALLLFSPLAHNGRQPRRPEVSWKRQDGLCFVDER